MMGDRRVDQAALFYEFSLERHVPSDHMLRAIDRFVDLDGIRAHVAPFYSPIGRPSIDPATDRLLQHNPPIAELPRVRFGRGDAKVCFRARRQ